MKKDSLTQELQQEAEKVLLIVLDDITLNLPVTGDHLVAAVGKHLKQDLPASLVEDLLQKFAAQKLIG